MYIRSLLVVLVAIVFPLAIVNFQAFITKDAQIEHSTTETGIDAQAITINQQAVPAQTKNQERTITLDNKITKKMISYSKCFVSYTPAFKLTVNGKEIKPGQKAPIKIKNDTLNATYHYNFLNGYKKGAKTVTFQLDPNKDVYEVLFSWQNDWRLLIPQAKPLRVDIS